MTKKQEGFNSRYTVPEHQWLKQCRDNCGEPRVKCKCGHWGHYVIHKGKIDGGVKYAQVNIMHSHFIEDVKIGRNKFCFERDLPLRDDQVEWRWFVKPVLADIILEQVKQEMIKK